MKNFQIKLKIEYLNECTALYKELESYSLNNTVNKQSCEILMTQLSKSIKVLSPAVTVNSQT